MMLCLGEREREREEPFCANLAGLVFFRLRQLFLLFVDVSSPSRERERRQMAGEFNSGWQKGGA